MAERITIQLAVDLHSDELDAKMDAFAQPAPLDKSKIAVAVFILLALVIVVGYGVKLLLSGGSVADPVVVVASAVVVPSVVAEPEPTVVVEAVPAVVVESEPAVVAESEPTVVVESEPAVIAESEPAVIAESEPAVIAESESAVITESEPAVVEQKVAEPIEQQAQTNPPVRAIFTHGIRHREPIDNLGEVIVATGQASQKIFFFTTIDGRNGQTIYHRWLYQGNPVGIQALAIGSDHWRTYSLKTIPVDWIGSWTVEVLDSEQKLVASYPFIHQTAK